MTPRAAKSCAKRGVAPVATNARVARPVGARDEQSRTTTPAASRARELGEPRHPQAAVDRADDLDGDIERLADRLARDSRDAPGRARADLRRKPREGVAQRRRRDAREHALAALADGVDGRGAPPPPASDDDDEALGPEARGRPHRLFAALAAGSASATRIT